MKKRGLGTRLFSLLLTLALCLAALPLQVLAEEVPETGPAAPGDAGETDPYALEPVRPGRLLNALAGDAYSRGQWLQELESVFGLTADEDTWPDVYYPDVESSAYFDAVMTAVAHGLSDVEPGGPFEPEGPLTRDYAAHTLNYLLALEKTSGGYTFSDSASTDYPDDAQAVVDAGWLALAGGSFLPQQAVTEAEARTMLDGARTELEKREEAPAENSYVLADYVIQIPKTAQVETRENAVRITGFDGVMKDGDVFAIDYQGLPFVYTADYVEQDEEDALVIVTSDAPEDAVVSLNFSGAVTPEVSFTPDERVMTLADGNGDPIVFGAARAVSIGKDSIRVSRSITLASGVTGSLNVDLTHIDIVPLSDGGKKGFALTGDLSASSTVKFDLLNDRAAADLTLGRLGLEPFGSVSLSIQLNMEAKMSYAYSGTLRVGVYYRDAFTPDVSFRNGQTTLSADGAASAKLTLKGQLSIPVIASASVQASVGPVIKANAHEYSSGTPRTCVTISGYLEAGASVSAKFGLKSYNKNFPIYTEKNSPIRVYEHVEDGKTVYACTRGASGGAGSYTPPKYITPGNSRIYASGSSSGSSTWTGSGGEQITIWTTEANETGVTVTGYKGGASVLNIPETIDGATVTAIGNEAFRNNRSIRVVNMPDTVTSIGGSAFFGCTNLRTVSFSINLTKIEDSAFRGCTSLTRVELPEGLTRLGEAFEYCTALEYAYIPSTLESCSYETGYSASAPFYNCASLDNIVFGQGIPALPSGLFFHCTGLTHIEIPDTVTSIGSSAFRDCTGMTSARLPDSVTELGSSTTQGAVFQGCSSLTSFQSSPALKTIGVNCFQNCSSLTDVTLNRGLREIGSYAFQNCAALEEIVLPDTVTGVGSYVFQKDPKLVKVTLSKGLSEIPSYAFAGCTALERLDIPQGVKTVRDHAFYQDTALKTFTIPQSVTSIESNAFSYPTSTTVYGVPGSYAETFARWKEFIPITIVPVTGLVLDRTELALTEGGSQALTASVLPGDATNRTVLWSTNNTAAAEVSPDGVVIAKKAGRATVTAKTADGGYTASCAVTVTAAPVQPDQPGPSGNTMGPKNELTWARNGRTLTVTGPVSAAEPLWAAAYDQNGRLLSVSPVTASGGSARLPDGAASVRLIWTDPGRAPKCASVSAK